MTEQPALSFADLLKELRTDAGLTQERLAAAAGLSSRSVSDLERGINKTARRDTTRLLADALKLTGTARAGFEAAARGHTGMRREVAGKPARANSVAAITPVLPHDIRNFTGRDADLSRLIAAVQGSGAVVGIYAIDGMAGVGKSAFAVHAAHVLAPRYPDGQIFLQLHAHTVGHRPVDPTDALASLLLIMGVAAERIPPTLPERSALWRSRLAGQRILLLLDDAASHDQVRPLLPGTPGSLVLITSRRHLSALDDATSICIETLPPDEAAALLSRLANRPDLDAGDPAVRRINQLCGHLPLAIGMLARQLHHHPTWSAAGLARDLAGTRDRLGLMRAENLSITAAFDLSYRDLAGDDQRLFRRLGLHPGTDIDSYAAAALQGCGLAEARRGLGELFDHHLATEPVSGRFQLHDLIREHARALAETDELEDRDAAIDRLTDYYVNAATAVGRHFERGDPERAQSPAEVPDPGTRTEAAAWMEAERANLQAIVNHAATRERPHPGLAISAAMSGFLRAHGHWTQMENLHVTALETARKAGSQLGEAGALVNLGIIQRLRGDYAAAAATLRRALGLCYELSDQHGQAQALVALGIVQRLAVGYPTASATLTRALALYEIVRDWIGQADALNELGFVQRLTGDSDIARASHERALELYQTHRDRLGQADSLRYLGRAHQELGNYAPMASCYDEALLLYRALEDPLGQAHALSYLGTAQHVSEKYLDAEATLNTALEMYRELGHRLGQAEVHNHLGDLYSVSDPARALGYHQQALAIVRGMSAILEEARALEGIGTCHLHDGKPGRARTHLRRAMELYRHLGSPYATRVGETLRFHRL